MRIVVEVPDNRHEDVLKLQESLTRGGFVKITDPDATGWDTPVHQIGIVEPVDTPAPVEGWWRTCDLYVVVRLYGHGGVEEAAQALRNFNSTFMTSKGEEVEIVDVKPYWPFDREDEYGA